jgi:hypothetical protein
VTIILIVLNYRGKTVPGTVFRQVNTVARPSVLEGIGRNIDLFGVINVYNHSGNAADADARAFVADIVALTGDFDSVLQNLNGEQK